MKRSTTNIMITTATTTLTINNNVNITYTTAITQPETAAYRYLINNCGSSFGYVINQGDLTMIKLIGIKEETDNS